MPRRHLLLLALMLTGAPAADLDADGIPDSVESQLGSDPARAQAFITALEDSDDPEIGGIGEALDPIRLEAACVGNDRWLWRVSFVGPADPVGTTFIIYLDADADPTTGRQDKPEVLGTDIMYAYAGVQGSETVANPTVAASRPARARYAFDGGQLYISDDIALPAGEAAATVRVRLLAQAPGKAGDSTDFVTASIPRVKVASLPSVKPPSGLAFRGLPGKAVRPTAPRPEFGRPRPPVPYLPITAGRAATVAREEVPIELLEEQGRDRTAALVSFGLPLPRGTVFAPSQVALLGPEGRPLPHDAAVTSRWPDGSLRWLQMECATPLSAGKTAKLTAVYGSQVTTTPESAGWGAGRAGDTIVVDAGLLQANIGLSPLRLSLTTGGAAHQGQFQLVDGAGRVYQPRGGTAAVEYQGTRKLIWRIEAPYADDAGKTWFRAIVRLTFRRDWPAVEVAHTLVDDNLEWEFAEFRHASLALTVPGLATARFGLGADAGPLQTADLPAGRAQLFVPNDQSYVLGGERCQGRTVGVVDGLDGAGNGLAVGVADFWQRYPKGLEASDRALKLHLFPPLDGPAAPGDLPSHLSFPFVENHYRFKWGMSTTDRFVLAPHRAADREAATQAALEAVQPVVAVLPGAYYEQTGALGEMVGDRALFPAWDEQFEQAFQGHLKNKEAAREYGFFNWGDWYGERGTNWGNNEYDLPHGLFMQFARTGRRDYFRLALAGARHQADVDIVHAYPDPLYLGGNILHSVAHTGEWSQDIKERQWSFPYSYHAAAYNGHTWASGMCDAWYLSGDPRVMEAALALGEHIAWQMAPAFKELGTHERSAGWSGHAIAELYRATADPVYLQALEQIVAVAYREQNFAENGAWPHLLPSDHAGGVAGARGNVSFLIGVLLNAIDDHYALQPSDQAVRSLTAATSWLKTQWMPEIAAFQYTSSPAYRASARPSIAVLNTLILGPMLRVAELTGDEELLRIGARGFAAATTHGFDQFGKSLSQVAHFAPAIMARLRRLGAPAKPYGADLTKSSEELRRADLAAARAAEKLNLRGPVDKLVLLRHRGGAGTVAAVREPWGAKPKEDADGRVRLVAPGGKVLGEATFSTEPKPFTFTVQLEPTAPPGDYRLEIHDDLRGRWDVSGPGARLVPIDPPVAFGGPGTVRWYFRVPAGTRAFRAAIEAGHEGRYGLVVYRPDGSVAGEAHGSATAAGASRTQRLEINAGAGPNDAVWSLVAYAGMDLTLSLEGVPALLATRPDDLRER